MKNSLTKSCWGPHKYRSFNVNSMKWITLLQRLKVFFNKRNSENARKFCLNYSGLVTFASIFLMLCIQALDVLSHSLFIGTFTVFMGILGAYVSIWGRYTRYALEGVSSKWLYVIESLSRLLIGGIFAFVALLAVKCGIAFSFIDTNIETYAYGLCGLCPV